MILLRRITSISDTHREDLCALLIDAVEDGASVGFLSPLFRRTADEYWRERASRRRTPIPRGGTQGGP